MTQLLAVLQDTSENLLISAILLAPPAVFFAVLAFAVKRGAAIAAAKKARQEVRINLWFYVIDSVVFVPLMAVVIGAVVGGAEHLGLTHFQQQFWAGLGQYPVLFAVVFLGDFESYWRHRFEHTRIIWPSHAIHHSDTEMTWLTLERFHPINLLTTTLIDSAFLSLMGFPVWAIVANTMVRHYYGYLIHADLPWTYGPLSRIFVSPAMHHWHHAKDFRYAGTNFATVFSVFDIAFGTYKPGICDVPVGIEDDMGVGLRGQFAYPFKIWSERWRARTSRAATEQRPPSA
jgi:sterol desaturase/sphingolipid hydroxylase (fatty acid hydroxylase superfamily)